MPRLAVFCQVRPLSSCGRASVANARRPGGGGLLLNPIRAEQRLFLAILIAAVSNLDNLGVGFALGIRGTRVAAIPNLIIATVTMAGTAGAMSFGRALSSLLSPSTAPALGSLIIIGVGAASILASLVAVQAPTRPGARDRGFSHGRLDRTGRTSYGQALVVGLALSLNNVGSGIGAGVAGVPPLATTLLAGAFSLLCIGGGSSGGQLFGRGLLGSRAPLVSGLTLVLAGIVMLFGAR